LFLDIFLMAIERHNFDALKAQSYNSPGQRPGFARQKYRCPGLSCFGLSARKHSDSVSKFETPRLSGLFNQFNESLV
jgi:hypothetical protein